MFISGRIFVQYGNIDIPLKVLRRSMTFFKQWSLGRRVFEFHHSADMQSGLRVKPGIILQSSNPANSTLVGHLYVFSKLSVIQTHTLGLSFLFMEG